MRCASTPPLLIPENAERWECLELNAGPCTLYLPRVTRRCRRLLSIILPYLAVRRSWTLDRLSTFVVYHVWGSGRLPMQGLGRLSRLPGACGQIDWRQDSGASMKVARGSRYVGVRYSGVLIDVCSMRLCGIEVSLHGAEAGTSIGAFSVALKLHSTSLSTLNPAAPQQSHRNVQGRRRPMAFAKRHHHIAALRASILAPA